MQNDEYIREPHIALTLTTKNSFIVEFLGIKKGTVLRAFHRYITFAKREFNEFQVKNYYVACCH